MNDKNSSIWLIDETQTDTTIPGQSRPESNGNGKVTPYSPDLQKGSFIIRCSLVSYQGWPIGRRGGGVLPLCKKCNQHILSSANWADKNFNSTKMYISDLICLIIKLIIFTNPSTDLFFLNSLLINC